MNAAAAPPKVKGDTGHAHAEVAGPGRNCPLGYRYDPAVFAGAAPAALAGLEVLYVVGGLYGDELALARVLTLFRRERGRKALVFNGDFHWFDVDPGVFERVQRGVLAHHATRGNVETELANRNADAGGEDCGCAYPAWVDDAVVARSNQIMRRLRTATTGPQRAELAALPMWLRADVGEARIGIVHGDAVSLAGWGFSQEAMSDPQHQAVVAGWFGAAQVDIFASTHSCLPVFQAIGVAPPSRAWWVANNGAAGLPNFAGDHYGLFTRIALTPCEHGPRRFGIRRGAVSVDAIAIEIDVGERRERFLKQWPPGSDGHASYFDRLSAGPRYQVMQALRTGAVGGAAASPETSAQPPLRS